MQSQQQFRPMANTRIKTTPTRIQKEALSAAVTSTDAVAVAATTPSNHVGLKRNFHMLNMSGDQSQGSGNIEVPSKKSTSPADSTIFSPFSFSDTLSVALDDAGSDATTASDWISRMKVRNSKDAFSKTRMYMITEKNDDELSNSNTSVALKRKMFLILEEGNEENGDSIAGTRDKNFKHEYGNIDPPKKLTLVTDKSGGLSENIGELLPEILSCIHEQQQPQSQPQLQSQSIQMQGQPTTIATAGLKITTGDDKESERIEKLPITLPPKKNRTKIATTHGIGVTAATANSGIIFKNRNNRNLSTIRSNNHHNNANSCNKNRITNHNNSLLLNNSKNRINSKNATSITVNHASNNLNLLNGNSVRHTSLLKQASAATPVIVSPPTVPPQQESIPAIRLAEPEPTKALSTDFTFLMNVLPKLHSMPEPHKNHVKDCISKIVEQQSTTFTNIEGVYDDDDDEEHE